MEFRKTKARVGAMNLVREGRIAFGVDDDRQGVFFLNGDPVGSAKLESCLKELMQFGLLDLTTAPVSLTLQGQQLYGAWMTEVLSPTRREMLRQVATTEIVASRDMRQKLHFAGRERYDGTSANALVWLMLNGGYITTAKTNDVGFPIGLLELTAKGRRWMQLNIPGEKLR